LLRNDPLHKWSGQLKRSRSDVVSRISDGKTRANLLITVVVDLIERLQRSNDRRRSVA
jgi:hypothetical protein